MEGLADSWVMARKARAAAIVVSFWIGGGLVLDLLFGPALHWKAGTSSVSISALIGLVLGLAVAWWDAGGGQVGEQFTPGPSGQAMDRESADAVSEALATHKVCPDCAEQVLAAARVCRFCRYQFQSWTAATRNRIATSLTDLCHASRRELQPGGGSGSRIGPR